MATETILMTAVKRGGDRQELHERIRVCSMIASDNVKIHGKTNNLIKLIANEPGFMMTYEEIEAILNPDNFTGNAPEQTEEFVKKVVIPRISVYDMEFNEVEIKE